MKILFRVLGTIALAAALLICGLGAVRNFNDARDVVTYADEIEESRLLLQSMKEGLGDMMGEDSEMSNTLSEGEEAMNDLPGEGTFKAAAMLMILLLVLSVVSAVFLYVPRQKVALALLALTVIGGIILIAISPSFDTGITGGATNRAIAIAAVIPAFLVALFAFLTTRVKTAKIA